MCKKTFTEAFHANYTARQEACPTPTVATKWFIPSVAEWLDIKNSYEALASSLTTAGGTVVKFDGSKVYWSSNIRSAAICWGFQGKGDDVTTLLKTRNYGKEKSQYRWIMAF